MKLLKIGIVLFSLLLASFAQAAGQCHQTVTGYTGSIVKVVITCTGSSSNGSIPDTAFSTDTMKLILGDHFLYSVSAFPTAGGTAPDAADVFVLDANGEDLLGSTDGGTTANKGANLIHATLKKTTLPYSGNSSQVYFPAVVNTLTLRVGSQTTVSATYTIEFVFVKYIPF